MDRKAYKLPFQKNGRLRWLCPTCAKGVLRFKQDTFNFEETAESKKAHGHEVYDPEWITYVYSCLMECTNPACKEIIANSGFGSLQEFYNHDQEGFPTNQEWQELFYPKHFSPNLKIFKYPKSTPDRVAEEIEKSFSQFFSDASSAANHIRIALEELLTHLKIKRYTLKGNKRTLLSLHSRIQLLPTKYNHLKDLFFAVKWLGNAGSHSGKDVTMDDVLDAYEIMEEILRDLIVRKTKKVKKIAKQIVNAKGPARNVKSPF
jgi:hypothetical protein